MKKLFDGREFGGKKVHRSGVCRASIDTSTSGINGGMNGGRICWAVSGTFCAIPGLHLPRWPSVFELYSQPHLKSDDRMLKPKI